MDEIIMRIIEMAPAVGGLLFIVIGRDAATDTLVQALVDCFNHCDEHDEDGRLTGHASELCVLA